MKTLRTSNCEINMVANEHCALGTCKNDSRYPELWTRNKKGNSVFFYAFLHQRDRLRRAMGGLDHAIRATVFNVKRSLYLQSSFCW